MPRDDALSTSERIVARSSEVGFSIPPVALRLKLTEGPHYWTLFMQPVPPGPAPGIAAWLEPYGPLRLEFGSRHVLRADFDPLPAVWASTFRGVTLDMLHLHTDGQAIVSVRGAREALAGFTRRLRGPTVRLDIKSVGGSPQPPRLLTAPQDQALRAAVEVGYYLIPRPLNLRQLAKRMLISSASLSERLRRAEGRVVTRYVNEGGRSPWDEKTLYDPREIGLDESEWPDIKGG